MSTTALLVSIAVVITVGIFHLYDVLLRLLSKTRVQNKVVLITDSLSVLGHDCAKRFHKRGARLILCGKEWEKLESFGQQLVDESDPTVTFPPKLIELDFGDIETIPDVLLDVLDCYGYVDILIINSSMKVKAPAQSFSLQMDKMVMNANYFGPITLAKGVLPTMIFRKTGHILLINSIQGKLTVPFRTTYAASKHAVQAFFDCLRAEVQEFGISVSTINHTFINPSPAVQHTNLLNSIMSVLTGQKSHGVSPDEMTGVILKTLSNKKNEIIMAHSMSKVAIYARSLFPNLFFAVMAAGVRNTSAVEQAQSTNNVSGFS